MDFKEIHFTLVPIIPSYTIKYCKCSAYGIKAHHSG
ncbi:hypothetical protein J2X97_003813, partial [Epilithonimonas hungarica]|nr:hypothetical protein [Epilithonimonas hungarica]